MPCGQQITFHPQGEPHFSRERFPGVQQCCGNSNPGGNLTHLPVTFWVNILEKKALNYQNKHRYKWKKKSYDKTKYIQGISQFLELLLVP